MVMVVLMFPLHHRLLLSYSMLCNTHYAVVLPVMPATLQTDELLS